MIAYWNNLNDREKWMAAGAGLCLILYFYYLFLYSPLSHNVSQKSTQLTEKIVTLAWLKKIRQQNHATKIKQKIDNSQLLTLLATQLKDNSTLTSPYQLQQTGTGDVQLTFEEVSFNLFITWLEKINGKYTVTIKQFDADHSARPGVVRLMIVLSAGS